MNTNSKLRVALFFGGVSSEHDVSCVSASAWLRALGQEPCADKYEVFPVGITKDGRWLACRPTPEAMADGSWEQGDCTPCVLSPDRKDHGIWLLKDGKIQDGLGDVVRGGAVVADVIAAVLQNGEIRLEPVVVLVCLNEVAFHNKIAAALCRLHIIVVGVHGSDNGLARRGLVGGGLGRGRLQIPAEVLRSLRAALGRERRLL